MEEVNKMLHKDYNPITSDISDGSFDSIKEIFKEEKGGKTIDKELEDFSNSNSIEREEINDSVEEQGGFSIDDLDSDGGIYSEEDKQEEEEEEEEPLEDYFESAEFIIFILELAIVFGTNFYLKQKNLDKIGIEEFEKTSRQQKSLVKSWAKVLKKHNAKVSPEVELLFNMGASYGIKIQGIVKRQEERKLISDRKLLKNVKSNVKSEVKNNVNKKSESIAPKRNRDIEVEKKLINENEEVLENEVDTKIVAPIKNNKKSTGWGLDTTKKITKTSDLI